MSSVVLDNSASTGAPNTSTLTANGCRLGKGGISSSGNVVLTQGGGVVVSPNKNQQAPVLITARGDGLTGNVASLTWEEYSAALPQVSYNWQLGTGGGGGAIQEGHFSLDAYVSDTFSQGVVEIGPCPRGAAGPPVIPPASAIFGLVSPAQAGVGVIALGTATIAVANTSVQASTIIMLTGAGVPDATATSFTPTLNPGVGFTITANANATAAKDVYYFIVRY